MTYFVQVVTPHGLANEPELFKLAYGHNLGPAAIAELDQASEDLPVYGWRTIARVDEARLARAITALIGRGIGGDDKAHFQSRIVTEDDLEAEGEAALERAIRQLNEPEAEYGKWVHEAAEAVIAAWEEHD